MDKSAEDVMKEADLETLEGELKHALRETQVVRIWERYRIQSLIDLGMLLCDQDPQLTVEMGFYPNTGCRIDMEQWDDTRNVLALNLVIILSTRGDYHEFMDIVNEVKVQCLADFEKNGFCDAKSLLLAIEWGKFLR